MKGQDNPLIPNPHPHLLNSTIKKPIIVPSSYQPKKTHKPRKAIRTTEISQSSGPINLVADETVYKEWEDRMERAATTASSLDAEQDSGNINRTQSMATLNESFPQGTDSGSGPRCQDTILGGADAQNRFGEQKEKRDVIVDFLNTSHIKFALTKNPTIYTSLIQQFWQTASTSTLKYRDVEKTATIDGQLKTITEASLRRHLKLEDADGISSLPNTEILSNLLLWDKVLALETDLQQTMQVYSTTVTKLILRGRMIDDIDQDAGITLVTPTKTSTQEDHPKDQLGVLSAAKVLIDVARVHTYSRRRRTVSTGSGEVSTASRIISTTKEIVSTASASMPISTAGLVQEITSSSRASKDKGKAVITDLSPSKQLQTEEREKYSEVNQAKMLVDLINQRKRFFAQQKAEVKRNKPMTQAQKRTYMSNYIKHQEEGYSIKQLKSLSFEEVKEIFETTMRRVHSFVPMDSELEVQ
ncbi:hypothetical protein Tco_0766639 [Tanacetum coccineum]